MTNVFFNTFQMLPFDYRVFNSDFREFIPSLFYVKLSVKYFIVVVLDQWDAKERTTRLNF